MNKSRSCNACFRRDVPIAPLMRHILVSHVGDGRSLGQPCTEDNYRKVVAPAHMMLYQHAIMDRDELWDDIMNRDELWDLE